MTPHYETRDVDLAATIIATIGLSPIKCQRLPEGDICVLFEPDERIKQIEALYDQTKIRVEPIMYSAVLRYLDSEVRGRPLEDDLPSGLFL